MKSRVLAAIALGLLLVQLAWAETYRLFDASKSPHPRYDEIVAKLGPGDVLVFSDGTRHSIGKPLGSGNSARIFEIEGGQRAIRIPKDSRPHLIEAINEGERGYKKLVRQGAPTVRVDRWYPGEFAEMEKLTVEHTFLDFLGQDDFDLARPSKKLREFFELARDTAHIALLGDFHAEQLAYTKERGWVILDWNEGFELAIGRRAPAADNHLFADFKSMREIYKNPKLNARWEKFEPALEEFIDAARRAADPKAMQVAFENGKPILTTNGRALACGLRNRLRAILDP